MGRPAGKLGRRWRAGVGSVVQAVVRAGTRKQRQMHCFHVSQAAPWKPC